MVGIFTDFRCNWCSLTSASPARTKIFVGRKTLNDIVSFPFFTRRLTVATVWMYKRKTVCSLHGGHFNLMDFLIKRGVAGHVMQL